MDAARLLPLLGVLLVMVPMLWGTGEARPDTSSAILYLFGVWACLVALAYLVSVRLRRHIAADAKSDASEETSDDSV
ncbi:hypothetical protein [Algirhabdus cladophorae]|uniref:hypothetical protein n=1 Tax=Algirhabdus cladophorae TaxID=3377108 RepID=UPI003B84B1B7